MLPTRSLATQSGFFKRSAEELTRLSKIAWNTEGIQTPTKPYVLLNFEDKQTAEECKTMSDRAVAGFSTANLDYEPGDPSTNVPPHARFHGNISTKLPDNFRVERTGYAAFRNKDRGVWLFGRLTWDVDPYAYLALRVKSDGRRYTINIQTDSIVDTDIHQHRLYTRHHRVRSANQELYPQSIRDALAAEHQAKQEATAQKKAENPEDEEWFEEFPEPERPSFEELYPKGVPNSLRDVNPEEIRGMYPNGIPDALGDVPTEGTVISTSSSVTTSGATGWETVLLPFNSFVRTNHGYVMEPQTSIMKNRVKSIGIGLTDRIDGPYNLCIHKIWATNGMTEEDAAEDRRICGSDALPVDEGVQTGWVESKRHEKEESKEASPAKEKGLKGLRSEWDD
ncbi:hypothetical protein N7532_001462 [Penicillium argentinense]|uniref:NADH:ubiquinone oxidoreductase intermediate-associated protein 30 domain-containing protein n=1 Tax=Penicillium argentinense TaxID=1131581 RepID=A0A9W9KMI3_9EURO|nr:uncharacterized protein N7532_001462 [Penicillium argentinense]KAJ5110927.1 hypothetical protein N7532_001462 [Penicillium argentinense]